jgi:hypothetical protein
MSGNQLLKDMKGKKVKWIGVDDATLTPPSEPKSANEDEYSLVNQKIRSFMIEYIPFVGALK